MRTILSLVIIVIAAVIGFFLGSGMNESTAFATLFAVVAGFGCVIHAIDSKKQ